MVRPEDLQRRGPDQPQPASDVVKNIPGFADDMARVITATIAGVRVIGAYFPNGQEPGSTSSPTRCAGWTPCANWVRAELAAHPKLVLLGDYNITFDDRMSGTRWAWPARSTAPTKNAPTFARPDRPGPDRLPTGCLPSPKRATAGGTTACSVSRRTAAAHRPHPGQRSIEAAGARLHDRPGAAQEPAAKRPRARHRDAGLAGITPDFIALNDPSTLGNGQILKSLQAQLLDLARDGVAADAQLSAPPRCAARGCWPAPRGSAWIRNAGSVRPRHHGAPTPAARWPPLRGHAPRPRRPSRRAGPAPCRIPSPAPGCSPVRRDLAVRTGGAGRGGRDAAWAMGAGTGSSPSTSGGRSFSSITCAGAITVSQWQMFSSWRTLPGKPKVPSRASAASVMRLGSTPS
jgi:hypothetical protein